MMVADHVPAKNAAHQAPLFLCPKVCYRRQAVSSQRSKGMLELNREQVVLATAPKPMSRLLAHGIHGLEGL